MKRATCELCQFQSPRVHMYTTEDPQPRAQNHKSLDQVLMKIASEIAHMHHPKNCSLYWVLILMMAFPFHLKVFSFTQGCLDFDNIFFRGSRDVAQSLFPCYQQHPDHAHLVSTLRSIGSVCAICLFWRKETPPGHPCSSFVTIGQISP